MAVMRSTLRTQFETPQAGRTNLNTGRTPDRLDRAFSDLRAIIPSVVEKLEDDAEDAH